MSPRTPSVYPDVGALVLGTEGDLVLVPRRRRLVVVAKSVPVPVDAVGLAWLVSCSATLRWLGVALGLGLHPAFLHKCR